MNANESGSDHYLKMDIDIQIGGDHYKKLSVPPWDAMESWMPRNAFIGYLEGNAIKYLSRWRSKGGIDDIKKANHYIEKLIMTLENTV